MWDAYAYPNKGSYNVERSEDELLPETETDNALKQLEHEKLQ